MPSPDEVLISRLRSSDVGAFRVLFEKYQPILFRSVLQSLRDADMAHDIVQETFVRVWNHRASLDPSLSFLGYIFRISGNLVRDHAKHQEVRVRLEARVPTPAPSAYDDPEGLSHLNILQEKLAESIQKKLPPKCRQIFLLSRMEGMSNKEIAERLGVSPKTVENQIARALKILRRHLRGYVSS